MKKVIVCTTINSPTEAIQKYDSMSDWHLVVIGDKKTPSDYQLENGTYISADEQEKMAPELSESIGWNCIQRRNFGLLVAHQMGADIVSTVDDDNIPLDGWGLDINVGKEIELTEFQITQSAFDPIGATNYSHIWHRGFPLQLLPERNYASTKSVKIKPMVQADFWNGDPDIDAICRMEHKPDCNFDEAVFPFTANKPGPFNSQNTFIHGSLLPEYFLFPHVGRMDDIWASYYVQALGHRVIYNKATVYQDRNVHNLITDMKNEYLGYENNLQLIDDLAVDPKNINKYLPERSIKAWENFRKCFK